MLKNACPHCEVDLRGDPIPEEHFIHKDDCDEQKVRNKDRWPPDGRCFCLSYGEKEPEDRFYSRIIGIEQPGVYDGVLYWMCPDCGKAWQRWSDPKMELYQRAQKFIDEINSARDAAEA